MGACASAEIAAATEAASTDDSNARRGFYTAKAAFEAARRDATTGEVDVALVDARWLLTFDASKEGGLPCRQQLPPGALFDGSVDVDDVETLSISYPWLTEAHPDPEGWHLRIVQHFLRLYFTMEGRHGRDALPPAGAGKRVAVFWDWPSLYQEHSPTGRTDAQVASFKRALKSINVWYANAQTMVWRLTKLPPAPRPGHDIKVYELRGWCFFELAVGEMITQSDRVLDFGLAVGDDGACFDEGRFFDKNMFGNVFGGWMPGAGASVVKTCSAKRKFPISASAFSEALATRVFTNGADADFVKRKYAETFQQVIAETTELNLARLSIHAPLAELTPALEVCGTRLRTLNLSWNNTVSGDLGPLRGLTQLTQLELCNCKALSGDLGPLQGLTQLTKLDLSYCKALSGDLGPLQGLTQLTQLDLSYCKALSGDLGPLRGLTQLTKLELCYCAALSGDLGPLQGLTQLTKLELSQCRALSGDLGPLRGLTQLTHLSGCAALSGDLGPLQGLTQLTQLRLCCCEALSGDLGPLQGLTQLTQLELCFCKALSGDLGPLQGLTQLTKLDLTGCEALSGDLEPLRGLTQLTKLELQLTRLTVHRHPVPRGSRAP